MCRDDLRTVSDQSGVALQHERALSAAERIERGGLRPPRSGLRLRKVRAAHDGPGPAPIARVALIPVRLQVCPH
jgi:hypothetical protein